MNFSIFRIKSTTKNIAIKQHIYYFYPQRCIFGWIFCIVELHPSKSTKNKIKYNPAIHVCVSATPNQYFFKIEVLRNLTACDQQSAVHILYYAVKLFVTNIWISMTSVHCFKNLNSIENSYYIKLSVYCSLKRFV